MVLMIREKVVEGLIYVRRRLLLLLLHVKTLHSSDSQGVAVPISASGLIGLQPLRYMIPVGKGSRQIRSVTSGEGLALRNVLRVCVGFVHALDQASGSSLRSSRPRT